MTRQDYILLAAALNIAHVSDREGGFAERFGGSESERKAYSIGLAVGHQRCVTEIADALATDNPRFDRDRFYDAVDSGQLARV